MNKVVIITGCCGFIGNYVTEACLQKGYYVIGIDKITYASRPELVDYFSKKYPKTFKFLKIDINDLDRLFDCDYIINLAAETHVDNSLLSGNKIFLQSNTNGVHNLLELIRTKSIFKMPTLIQMSTDEVMGDIKEGLHKETDILNPRNPYAGSKAAADMLILSYYHSFKVPYLIIRSTNNYGIGQYVEKLIPKTCKSILLGRKIPIHNNGTPRRVWLHAGDTARSIIHLIENNVKNEIYNVSGKYECSNIEIIKKIVKIMTEKEDPTEFCDFSYSRDGQDFRYGLNDSKLRLLGWNDIFEIDKELPSIVDYYKNNFVW